MDYLQVARDIIAIDTTVPPGRNYEKAMDYLEPLFREVGFVTEMVHIPREHCDGNEARVNLLAHHRSQGKPRLIFYGHIDVVPARGWPAFAPRVEDGKVYGRGAADMKGGVVAMLLGLDMLRGRTLKYDTSVMITTDEEAGQAEQLRYLGRFLQPLSGAYFFNLDSSFGYVSIAGLGAIQMDIIVKGKSVHSALSHRGENAVEKASLLVQALLKLKKKVVKIKSQVPTHPETGLRRMQARLNINMLQGGLKVNVVPDECLISIDRRLVPEENIEDARRKILDTLSSVAGVTWELGKVFTIPTVPPGRGAIIDELDAVVKQVTGWGGQFGEMGSGDLPSIVANEWGATEFGLGVIRAECNIHGKDEFAYQQDIEALAEIIARFASAG